MSALGVCLTEDVDIDSISKLEASSLAETNKEAEAGWCGAGFVTECHHLHFAIKAIRAIASCRGLELMLKCCCLHDQGFAGLSSRIQHARSPLRSGSRVISRAKLNRRETLVGLSLASQTSAVHSASSGQASRSVIQVSVGHGH